MKTSLRLALGLAGCLSLVGCGISDPYKLPYEKLELAMVSLDTGHEDDAVGELEALLAHTQEEAERFALQRFYASYLLTQAHVRAFRSDRAFLYEEVPVDPSLAGLVDASGRRPSVNAHLMASLLHAHDASAQLAAQIGAEREAMLEDGTIRPLLPARLMDFDVADVGKYLSLARLAALGELGFEDDVREIVSRVPDLGTVAGCEGLIESARIHEDARAELFVFQFRAFRPTDREQSFKFAVRALEEANNGDGTFDLAESVTDEINAFMESGFRCISCDTSVSGGFIYCPEDGSRYMDTVKDAADEG